MNEMRKLMETVKEINEQQQSTPIEFLSDLKGRIWELEKIAMAYRHALQSQAESGSTDAEEAGSAVGIVKEVEDECERLRRLIHSKL